MKLTMNSIIEMNRAKVLRVSPKSEPDCQVALYESSNEGEAEAVASLPRTSRIAKAGYEVRKCVVCDRLKLILGDL